MKTHILIDCNGLACNNNSSGVYLIKGDSGWRKIGFSNDVFDRCYGTRRSALQNGLIWPIFPLYNYKSVAYRDIEKRLHKKFEKNKRCPPNLLASGTSEWFFFDDPTYIDSCFIEECKDAEIKALEKSCLDLKKEIEVLPIGFTHEFEPDLYTLDMVNNLKARMIEAFFKIDIDVRP
jgi:hypothetical protein